MITRRKATAVIAAAAATALAGTQVEASGYTGKFINVMNGSEINNADIIQLQNYSSGAGSLNACCARTPGGNFQIGIAEADYERFLWNQSALYQYTVQQNQQIDNSVNDSFNDHSINDSFNQVGNRTGSTVVVGNCARMPGQ